MNDLGNLLQMIYDLLSGWYNSFTSHTLAVMEKLNLIETDTASIKTSASGIKTNTDDIKDNTGAIVTPVLSIKTNTDSIKTDTTTIKNNVSTMSNQLGTISTNVGTASAFTEDVANNTLDIKDKVVTIASDTTQIRSNTNTVVSDMSKVYEALKWALVDKVTTETEEGNDSVSFDTDLTNDLVSLEVGVECTQSGTGDPSTSNVRPITGVTDKSVTVNGNNITIALGQTVYNGVVDLVTGMLKITHLKATTTSSNCATYTYSGTNGVRFSNGLNGSYRYANGISNQAVCATEVGQVTSGKLGLGVGNNQIYWFGIIDVLGLADLQAFKDWLDLNPLDVIYELNTPIEVQLTPSQIATIKGINTVITDGNISVTYEESVKYYLDKQEA